ncbi:MAG TPA: DUF2007 domain-containing protein [Bacteroidales bacterium]|nr:DUF2007 domain-containing protein [Bacteroidales bacterium]HOK73670.1 DUF2007 domain-containing protein [Bacteroidales bacterium]HOM39334.1 DUF2007 domain-containing protein [Bacteroidales bacterium]HPP91442.1 DUF2007 domain-containing protein [Bacteroidales bacterium]HQG56464.1 DUF2007 domain-containing protein [Bacteroidales bacterium]
MEKEWAKVYETAEDVKIEIARILLKENGIDSVIINKKDRSYRFGELELYVHRDNVIRAKQLLKNL